MKYQGLFNNSSTVLHIIFRRSNDDCPMARQWFSDTGSSTVHRNPIITFSERRSRTSQDSSKVLWQWLVDIPLMVIRGFPDDFYQPLVTTGMAFKE